MKAIDLFAGWGGFTLGAEAAGVDVVWAGNHWPLAVEAHQKNHPTTTHVCQDLRQADWRKVPEYELLLASPACQGHSQASQPQRKADGSVARHHDALRATAWAVVDCADVTEPRAILVENVLDFRRWRLYETWCDALRRLGYHLQEQVLTASYFGVPQRRQRLFLVATRRALELELERQPQESPIGPHLEWDTGDWRPIKGASDRVKERIKAGRARCGDYFITQHVTSHKGIALDEPIRTITTQDQFALVDGDRYRPLTIRETARAMGFPDSYAWPTDARRRDVIKGLGNAVCPPVAQALITQVAEQA